MERLLSSLGTLTDDKQKINCNIRVKQGCSLSLTIFGIHIDKLEGCLEEVGCVGMTLVSTIIILFLYANDIVFKARSPYDLNKQLKFLKEFCSNMCMIVNTNKTKGMIIESQKITYYNFMYDNDNLEEVTSYKDLTSDFYHEFNWNYSI